MGLRRSLASAALATALTPAVLLAPSTARAASLATPAAPNQFASPPAWPTYCAGELPPQLPLDQGSLNNPDDHSDLSLATRGVAGPTVNGAPTPDTIAAGSGWHEFQLTASLPLQGPNSDLANSPHDLKWTAFVSDSTGKALPTSHVQYFTGTTWADLGQWAGAATKPVTTAFKISNTTQTATASLRLRVKIDAGAPSGPAYVAEFGSYADAQQSCTHFTFATDTITVHTADSWLSSSRLLQYAVAAAVVIAAVAAAVLVARRRTRP